MPPHRKGGGTVGGGLSLAPRSAPRSAAEGKAQFFTQTDASFFELLEPRLSFHRPTGGDAAELFASEGETYLQTDMLRA